VSETDDSLPEDPESPQPERLASVSWFPSQMDAEEESRKLREAGIEPFLAGEPGRPDLPTEILVPESQVEQARSILKIEAEPEERPDADAIEAPKVFLCPDCRAPDPYRLPPYAFFALIGSVGVGLVGFALGQKGFAAAIIAAGFLAAIFLSSRSGRYRCRNCGREWKPT
jgi:hypothetical protein